MGNREGIFSSHSSDIDWCEPNYVVTPMVAEFYNTVSNSLFLVLPVIMIYLFWDYGKLITRSCHLVWSLLMVVGLGSAYFHGTLSLAGQLMDELAIIWVLAAALALWTPKRLLHTALLKDTGRYRLLVAALTVLSTILGLIYPVVNNIVLMILGVPSAYMIYSEAKSSVDKRCRRLGYRACLCWISAVSIWISDRVMCRFWIWIGFPYLHSIWHVIMAFASYDIITFLAFKDTQTGYKHLQPSLAFWPIDRTSIGMPYIKFACILPLIHSDQNQNKVH